MNLSPREVSIVLAALEYWIDNHDDNDPCDRMSGEMEQETFGEAGQPSNEEVELLCHKLYPIEIGFRPLWRRPAPTEIIAVVQDGGLELEFH